MDASDDLRVLLASRHPLIVAETGEEERFMQILRRVAGDAGIPVWTWSVTRGLARDGSSPQYGTANISQALAFVSEVDDPAVFVFADAHHALGDPSVLRRLKEAAQGAAPGQTLVLTAPRWDVPPELRGLALPWRLEPPDREELEQLVRATLDDLSAQGFPVSVADEGVTSLVEAVAGLTVAEAEWLIRRVAVGEGRIDEKGVVRVREEKAELLEAGGVLELVGEDLGTLDVVCGMDRLKEWLRVRARALRPTAVAGVDPPRGILLTGVPGAGKSLVAKTLAKTWGLPLVLLDPARLYGPYVGESEQRLEESLRSVVAMAPVVLWIDEIEKGFATGDGDAGVSRRILGTFLRWMQDRPPGVFIVATSNDVRSLPPEFMRKGRFDEVFFVDLPEADDRAAMLRLHLARRGRDPSGFDLPRLAGEMNGFSGAEVEAVVVGAIYRAFADGKYLTTEQILEEANATVPLSRSRAEEIDALRTWARTNAVPA